MVDRVEWGAAAPKSRRYDVYPKGVALHWPGADARFRDMPHSKHREYVRSWQRMHMDRGSNDIEYGSVICPCGVWMECRTERSRPMVRVGSNGSASANRHYTSVQLMLGTREAITAQEIAWTGEAVAWLRGQGWGRALVGHRDLSQTSCPGDSITAAIPRIRAAADHPQQKPLPPPEDDVSAEDVWNAALESQADGGTYTAAAFLVSIDRKLSEVLDRLAALEERR